MRDVRCPVCGASPAYYVQDKTDFRFWCRGCRKSMAIPMHPFKEKGSEVEGILGQPVKVEKGGASIRN